MIWKSVPYWSAAKSVPSGPLHSATQDPSPSTVWWISSTWKPGGQSTSAAARGLSGAGGSGTTGAAVGRDTVVLVAVVDDGVELVPLLVGLPLSPQADRQSRANAGRQEARRRREYFCRFKLGLWVKVVCRVDSI